MPATDIAIRLLTPADAAAFCALRLRAILDSPSSFSSSREDELARTPDEHAQRIAGGPQQRAFGAFDGERLVGFAGLRREALRQLSHKAVLWGVFVDVPQQGQGRGAAARQCLHRPGRARPGHPVSAFERKHGKQFCATTI